MYENTWERVTFFSKLMFCRLDKYDGLVFGGGLIIFFYIKHLLYNIV